MRIFTLRKKQEVTQLDEAVIKEFERNGLSAGLFDITINSNPTDTGRYLFKKLVNAIKKRYKPLFQEASFEEKKQFLKEISSPHRSISVEPIEQDQDYFNSLLYLCSSLRKTKPSLYKSLNDQFVETYHPMKVTVTEDATTTEGYSLLGEIILENYHGTSRKLTNSVEKNYHVIWDITTLFATNMVYNSLIQFALENRELIQCLVIEEVIRNSLSKSEFPIPDNQRFYEDVKKVRDSYGMTFEFTDSEHEKERYKGYNNSLHYEDIFYLSESFTPMKLIRSSWLDVIVPEFMGMMRYLKDKAVRDVEQTTHYAKAYEDKKHVNQKTREQMENNLFLTHFGTVELDNDVCLDMFHGIEKEFVGLLKKTFVPKSLDYTFRVRKLGRHRAAGLYVHGFRSLIFDLDCPWAFFHELGHLIDYNFVEKGRREGLLISETMEFRSIHQEYKKCVQRAVNDLPDDDPFVIQWYGKTKYNKAYYFEPTEVFARSYELYLWAIKGIRSSLLKETYEKEAVYPLDEKYLSLVKTFFDALFERLVSEQGNQQPVTQLSSKLVSGKVPTASSTGDAKRQTEQTDELWVSKDGYDQLTLALF